MIFLNTDNSTMENCFYKESLSSEKLHLFGTKLKAQEVRGELKLHVVSTEEILTRKHSKQVFQFQILTYLTGKSNRKGYMNDTYDGIETTLCRCLSTFTAFLEIHQVRAIRTWN